jgi:flagellar biosynthesis/type III secretory pathway M-ring protein FliF/YscJ
MKTIYLMWRLARFLEKSRSELRAASIAVVVERESTASYMAYAADHARHGLPKPAPRTAYEVTIWGDVSQAATGSEVARGSTLAEALAAALK